MSKKKPDYSNFQAIISVDGQERVLTFRAKGITGGLQVTIQSLAGDKMIPVVTVNCEAKINGTNITRVLAKDNLKVFVVET
jgi:hypothetical protein